MRTRQEIFDLAWKGMAAQDFERSTSNGACAYRNERGLRCAIGHCIPDDAYSFNLEGSAVKVDGEPNRRVLAAANIAEADADFAFELQSAHGYPDLIAGVEDAMRAFAKRHSLTIPS